MEDHEKSHLPLACEAEARGENRFDDEEETAEAAPLAAAPPAPNTPNDLRYEFPIPSMAIFDLLGIQLAECTRMARTLADDVVVKPFTTSELPRIVGAFRDVVTSSAVIADTMDLVQNGRPRLPAPQRSGRS